MNRDHRDREILNHQILLYEEGDSLIFQDWLPFEVTSILFHLSSPTNSCIAPNLKHRPPPQSSPGLLGNPELPIVRSIPNPAVARAWLGLRPLWAIRAWFDVSPGLRSNLKKLYRDKLGNSTRSSHRRAGEQVITKLF